MMAAKEKTREQMQSVPKAAAQKERDMTAALGQRKKPGALSSRKIYMQFLTRIHF